MIFNQNINDKHLMILMIIKSGKESYTRCRTKLNITELCTELLFECNFVAFIIINATLKINYFQNEKNILLFCQEYQI